MKTLIRATVLFLLLACAGPSMAVGYAKPYSEKECQELGLVPILISENELFMPLHDGQHYFVMKSDKDLAKVNEISPAEVREAILNLKRAGKFVNDIASFNYVSSMPLVISKTIGGVSYDILLDKLVFTPQGNYISIEAMISFANDSYLCFASKDIKFTGQGGVTNGELSLLLGPNNKLEILDLEKITLAVNKGKLNFGCNGFESFGIGGNVVFDRSLIVPEDPNTGQVLSGEVMASFEIDGLADWNDMLFDLSIPNFQIPTIPDYGFSVQNASIDFSEKLNANGLVFPQNYFSQNQTPLWKGVSIGLAEMRLPKAFKKRVSNGSTEQIKLKAESVIIDNQGFTGLLEVEHVLKFEQGDLSGWDYSIDTFSLSILRNKVKGGGLGGKVRIAICDETERMAYKAIIDPSRKYYNFGVEIEDRLEFDFLKAVNVELDESSKIALELKEDDFVASALLNGKFSIGCDTCMVKLEAIRFEQLCVSTAKPRLSIGSLGRSSGSPLKLANFDVNLRLPQFAIENDRSLLSFGLAVNLDKAGVSAEGGFFVQSKFEEIEGRHFWKYEKMGVENLAVSGDFSAFSFSGELAFLQNDPIYGKGFYGDLQAKLKTAGNVELKAVAMFGKAKEPDLPYWIVDAEMATSSNGLSGINVDFIAGRMYKHMWPSHKSGALVKTLTGVVYEPNFDVGWGGQFGAAFSKGAAISIGAGLEIQTRADGAISKIGFLGKAAFAGNGSTQVNKQFVIQQYRMMTADSDLSRSGGITGKLDADPSSIQQVCEKFEPTGQSGTKGTTATLVVRLDFQNNAYYGKLGVAFAAPSFSIQATGAFLSSPSKWFVHIGEPPLSQRILLKAPGIPNLDAYFMIGDGVAALPDPEPNIFLKYPSKKGERNADVDPGIVATGRGIALGGAVGLDKSFNVFDILDFNLMARAGFDFMMIKYDEGFYCKNRPGQPIGVNNWRAMGQIYALASFGAKAFGFNVLSLDAGALLRGAAPNPTYATGQVAVSFKALFKRFYFNVGFSIGEDCELATSEKSIENLSLIYSNYPKNGELVSPQVKPKITTSEEQNKNLTDLNFEGEYQLQIDELDFKTQSGKQLLGSKVIDRKVLTFTPNEPFPAFETILARAKAKVFLNKNGSLEEALLENQPIEEIVMFTFVASKTDEEMKAELDAYKAEVDRQAEEMKAKADSVAKHIEKRTEEIIAQIGQVYDTVSTVLQGNCVNCTDEGRERLNGIVDLAGEEVEQTTSVGRDSISAILNKALTEVYEVADNAASEAKKVLDDGKRAIDNLSVQMQSEIDAMVPVVLKKYQERCSLLKDGAVEDAENRCGFLQKQAEEEIRQRSQDIFIKYGKRKVDAEESAISMADHIMEEARQKCDAIMAAAADQCQDVIDSMREECERILQEAAQKCESIAGYASSINMDEFIHNQMASINLNIIDDPEEEMNNSCKELSSPRIVASNTAILKGEEVILQGADCKEGSHYSWDNASFVGQEIKVKPSQKTTYLLECKMDGCKATSTHITIEVNDPPPVVVENPNPVSTQAPSTPNENSNHQGPCSGLSKPNVSSSSVQVNPGTTVQLSANQCLSGSSYYWGNGINQYGQNVSAYVEQSTYFSVVCQKDGCLKQEGGVYVSVNASSSSWPAGPCQGLSQPSISASSGNIAKGQQVTLNASGCLPGSTYYWSTGASGMSILDYPQGSQYYSVTCYKEGCEEQTNVQWIAVNDPCSGLRSPNVSADEYSFIAPSGVANLFASNCIYGSTIEWNTGDRGGQISKRIGSTTYFEASCVKPGCEKRSTGVTIQMNPYAPAPFEESQEDGHGSQSDTNGKDFEGANPNCISCTLKGTLR
ncbi:hypothetical protein LAG90_08665 [Marinilongibacter aquaticus]|uniref:hypothetical protein n=1 Tax=Marinilongibacter aquaticus TaxID=2975157 RepID=UPI0021BD4AF5|nr:hypothetical protein [Marinilongibacter aquaticus]UBM60706.1 hypothetical protein LAG90_08665 [Marinilongibacter aquaticus]